MSTPSSSSRPAMTSEQFKRARRKLGLSVNQMAHAIGVTPIHIRRLETDPDKSNARDISPTTARLVRAYLDGYRPKDWPAEARGDRS